MKRFWKRGGDGLETELRANRPEPRPELIESITERVRAESPRRRARPLQLAYAGALTAMLLVVLVAAGGVGSTSSALSSVGTKLASAVSGTSSPTVVSSSAGQTQYRPGKGCGDPNHIHEKNAQCTVSIGNASKKEGNSGTSNMDFTVSLSDSALSAVTVAYATSGGSATSGTDFLPVAGTLTFAIGQSSATVSVPIKGDTLVEPDETFTVTLTNPSANAVIGNATGTGTIINDDKK